MKSRAGSVVPALGSSGRPASHGLSRVSTAFFAIAVVHVFVLLLLHTLSIQFGRGGFSFVTVGGDDGYFHYETARMMVSTGNLSPGAYGVFLTVWPSVLASFMLMVGTTDILVAKTLLIAPNLVMLLAVLALFDVLDAGNAAEGGAVKAKVRLLVGVGLYPSLLSFSYGSLYRDSWIYCLFVLSVLILAIGLGRASAGAKFGALLLFPFSVYALYRFRDYAAVSVVGGCLVWGMSRVFGAMTLALPAIPRLRKTMLWLLHLGVFATFAVLFWLSPLSAAVGAYRNSFSTTEGGGNLGIQMDITNPVQTILVFPYSFLSNVFGPLPWQVTSAASVLSFLIEVPALLFVTRGLFRLRAAITRLDWLVLTASLAYFFVIALANDNVGTATRLRVAGWIPIFVVYAKLQAGKKGATPLPV